MITSVDTFILDPAIWSPNNHVDVFLHLNI